MKARGVLASILFIGWFGMAPTVTLGCCHHGNHCDDCDTYHGSFSDDCCQHEQGSGHCQWTASGAVGDLRTAEGRIAEIEYLPGATPDSGMVEVHLQIAGQSQLIRLAPVGLPEAERARFKGRRYADRQGIPCDGNGGRPLGSHRNPQGRKDLVLTRLARPASLVGCDSRLKGRSPLGRPPNFPGRSDT